MLHSWVFVVLQWRKHDMWCVFQFHCFFVETRSHFIQTSDHLLLSLSTRWRASSQSSSCAPVFTPPCFASESSTTTTWPPTTRPTPTASSSAACKWQQECFYFERILKGTCSGKIAVNQEKTWVHMFLSRMFLLIYKKNICTVSKNLKLLNFNTCSVERISSLSS